MRGESGYTQPNDAWESVAGWKTFGHSFLASHVEGPDICVYVDMLHHFFETKSLLKSWLGFRRCLVSQQNPGCKRCFMWPANQPFTTILFSLDTILYDSRNIPDRPRPPRCLILVKKRLQKGSAVIGGSEEGAP